MKWSLHLLVLVAIFSCALALAKNDDHVLAPENDPTGAVQVSVTNNNNVRSAASALDHGRTVTINGEQINQGDYHEHQQWEKDEIDHHDEHDHGHDDHDHDHEHEHEHEHEHDHDHDHDHGDHHETEALPSNLGFAGLEMIAQKNLAQAERDISAMKENIDRGNNGAHQGHCPECHKELEAAERAIQAESNVAATDDDKKKLAEDQKRLDQLKHAIQEIEQQGTTLHGIKDDVQKAESLKLKAAEEMKSRPAEAKEHIAEALSKLKEARQHTLSEEKRTQDPAEKEDLAQKEEREVNDISRLEQMQAQLEHH